MISNVRSCSGVEPPYSKPHCLAATLLSAGAKRVALRDASIRKLYPDRRSCHTRYPDKRAERYNNTSNLRKRSISDMRMPAECSIREKTIQKAFNQRPCGG